MKLFKITVGPDNPSTVKYVLANGIESLKDLTETQDYPGWTIEILASDKGNSPNALLDLRNTD